jgi:enoyl-CoA hydratase/3-hydroxyacyl-CoA dehydrogenase
MGQPIDTVAVIGAGVMGHGIAQAALMAGLQVRLCDAQEAALNNGVARIQESLDKLLAKHKIAQETYDHCRRALIATTDMGEAVAGAQMVFEAVPEVLEIKQAVFRKLDELTDERTILASNTSNMSISAIASSTRHPHRVLGVHFFNPVVLMKLVEVIKGEQTSEDVMQTAYDLCLRMNKTPVRVEKDAPSFIVNRINAPVRVYLGAVVDAGVAGPEEIDALLKSAGDPMGHFELSDFIGLDTVHSSMLYRAEALHPEYGPFRELEKRVKEGNLGRKTGRGFYDWTQGKPEIDLAKKTDKISVDDIKYIKYNEALKLIEEGVASSKDIDLAMVLGTGDKVGPVEACKDADASVIAARLTEIAETYRKSILSPSASLLGK